MATLQVKEGGGGSYYATLNAALSAASASDTIEIIDTWAADDTTNCTVSDANLMITAVGDARHEGVWDNSNGGPHRLFCSTNGDHCIEATTSGLTIDGLQICQSSTGSSDECIRFSNDGGTITGTDVIVWADANVSDQDGLYLGNIAGTVNLENCIGYGFGRASFHAQMYGTGSTKTQTWNVNCCTAWDNGKYSLETEGGGLATRADDADFTVNANLFRCIFVENDSAQSNDYDMHTISQNGVQNWDVHNCIDSDNSIATVDGSAVGCLASRAAVDSDSGAGNYVVFNDISSSPYDLRLQDLGNAKNNAQDMDNTSSGAGMSMPATDIAGTSRPQNTNYDCGAFEVVAAGGDLSIDTSQLINVSESITLAGLIQDLSVDLFEQLNLSEYVLPSMNLGAISIDETLELAESLISGVPIGFSRFENITLTEFLSLLETIAPSRFEQITITEYIALLKDIGLSEFENITINELIAANLESTGAGASDSIELSEFISMLKDIGVETAQQITITEVIAGVVSLAGIEAAEDVTITEAVSGILTVAGIDTSQSIEVSELINGILSVAGIDVSQDITITEFLSVLTTGDLVITEAFESVIITEALTLLFSHLPITEIQNINISEFVNALLETTGIDEFDLINISEYAALLISLATISASDSVTLSEAVTALLETTGADVYDTINIAEYIQGILEITGINIAESVTVSEFVLVTMVTVAGIMKINFSVRRPLVGYATRKPKITFN